MTNRENPIHRIKSYLGSGSVSGSGSGSMITDTDPRIRIQIKMIWIRNTAFYNLNIIQDSIIPTPGRDHTHHTSIS